MPFTRLLDDEQGATAIEYALIAVLVAIAAIVGMRSIGNEINTTFNSVGSDLKGATTTP